MSAAAAAVVANAAAGPGLVQLVQPGVGAAVVHICLSAHWAPTWLVLLPPE